MPIVITARPAKGFYRAGVYHPPTRTEYPDDAFTPEQMKAIEAEPLLVVEYGEGLNGIKAVAEAGSPLKDQEAGNTDEGAKPEPKAEPEPEPEPEKPKDKAAAKPKAGKK